MQQVFTNLLENAVQNHRGDNAGERQAPFASSQRSKSRSETAVPASPAGEEERVFQPFHTTRTQGVGLGLAVARRIVELHGGSLTAANHPEGGAIFTVSIPGSA